MTSTKIEFEVQMTCQKCVNEVENSLSQLNGVNDVQISLEQGSVIVDTELPHTKIQEVIESTGKKAVLKGYGENDISAVAMLGGNSGYSYGDIVKGVVRFVTTKNGCIVDGTIDGLSPGPHGLHIHECGDISQGEHFNPNNTSHGGPDDPPSQRHVGDLGNILANESGRGTFRILNSILNVDDIIGRSLVITEKADDFGKGDNPLSKIDGNSGKRLACGIIARSSGLFQNAKKICACDGLTLWDERDKSIINQKNENELISNS
ncbi:copper chaperone for superoxide dismutase isoform X1 [Copidosoma floridanum]|uniref:copper chaperone for superoxide dismutase isoform X1 n=1 Tax=Copidosoma floridanum TaxID=29053 RepID=UPI000C6FBCF1|nr:copper chaperone for superoxide dismutase isoform X1 [Copidosoma floridanum]